MSMTYAIYQQTEHGLLRVGTFRPKKATSVRQIAEQFFAKCPNAPRGKMYICGRFRAPGSPHGWADDVAGRVILE